MGSCLSDGEVQRCLDFCAKLFNPTSPEQHEKVSRSPHVSPEMLDVNSPVIEQSIYEDAAKRFGEEDYHGAKMVLDKVNARRIMHGEFATHNMELESLDGFAVRLETGNLGLKSA